VAAVHKVSEDIGGPADGIWADGTIWRRLTTVRNAREHGPY